MDGCDLTGSPLLGAISPREIGREISEMGSISQLLAVPEALREQLRDAEPG